MVDGSTRVALLARPGQARERLESALREAGAELVAVADPVSVEVGEVVAAAPQAILVALEPAIEDALDAYEPLLSDPAIAVIFDEADLAAQRAGWDAARWVRHLAAKLHRHDDVLPPGREQDDDWQPTPGPLVQQGYREVSEGDLERIAGQAQALAGDVPRDAGLDSDAGPAPGTVDVELEDAANEIAALEDLAFDIGALDDIALGGDQLQDVKLEGEGLEDFDLDGLVLEEVDFTGDTQGGAFEDVTLDDVTPASPQAGDGDMASPDTEEAGIPLPAEPDDTAGMAPTANDGIVEHELADLEARIAGLELLDVDSYGHGPERGAVLVEGGLGGPDAVRQLLAGIPAGFARPVLVRLRLDGGRYDRLVRQMARAALLPVALAEDGGMVEPAHVYFLPPDITVGRDRALLRFQRSDGAARALPASLPPGDSAVLFLSGSDPALVDAAMGQAWAGALVAGQSPEGCYDATATEVVIARGGESGMPARLAERLAERWPPPDGPADAVLQESET